MVSCDTNVLFAASNPDDAKHAEARAFLEGDSYEEMMLPLAETVTQLARDAKKSQFLTTFEIMKRGNTI